MKKRFPVYVLGILSGMVCLWPAHAQIQKLPSGKAAVTISIKNSAGLPQQGVVIELVGLKNKEKIKGRTNERGADELIIPRGQNYVLNLKGAPGYDTVVALTTSSQFFVFYVQYDGDRPGVRENPLRAQNLQANADEVLLDIEAPDFIGDTIEIGNTRTGKRKTLQVGPSGRVKTHIKKGDHYLVRWRGFVVHGDIYYPPSGAILSLGVRLQHKPSQVGSKMDVKTPDPVLERQINGVFAQTRPDTLAHKSRPTVSLPSGGYGGGFAFGEIYDRNAWKNALVVVDVTCSMDPYILELSRWIVLAHTRKRTALQFAFFNDGDGKANEAKQIGNTGGVHFCRGTSLDTIQKTLAKARSYGCSGDVPENNIEAMLKAIAQAKPFGELVLIADNNSPVRDMELLSQLKLPVRVVLCGSEYFGTTADYLNLARETGGSVHTMKQDLLNLAISEEGKEIVVNEETFLFTQGSFVRRP